MFLILYVSKLPTFLSERNYKAKLKQNFFQLNRLLQRNISPRSSLKRGGAMSETSYGGDTVSTAAGSDTEYYGIPSLLQRENSASVIARDGFISRVSVIFGLILSYLTGLAT